jgi:hypothetical protein
MNSLFSGGYCILLYQIAGSFLALPDFLAMIQNRHGWEGMNEMEMKIALLYIFLCAAVGCVGSFFLNKL